MSGSGRPSVGREDGLRLLDHDLDGDARQPHALLDAGERIDERAHLVDVLDLGEGDDELGGKPLRTERGEKPVERAEAPRVKLVRERLDADADERRQRASLLSFRDFLCGELDVMIFLGVGPRAVPIFEVDAEVFDGLTLELGEDAGVHRLRETLIETDRAREPWRVRAVRRERSLRELAELLCHIVYKEVTSAVHGVDGLTRGRLSRITTRNGVIRSGEEVH